MNKTTYSINITQTDDMGQNPSSLSMTTSDKEDLLRLLANAGITGAEAEEKWSDDPADQGVCPVCNQKPCGCDSVEEEYENTPKAEVVSTPGGNEFGEQRPQADQRRVTARQGDNPIKKEEVEQHAKSLEESYLNEWAEFQKTDEGSTGDYSAKKARAGKDIGKPGKNFAKIAKDAAERYGSKERGEKVAGAVLAKLRNEDQVEEGKKPDFLDLDKDGNKEEPMKDAAKDKEEKVEESSAELDYLKAIVNWSPKGAQPKAVTEADLNPSTGSNELDWLKAVVKYQPR